MISSVMALLALREARELANNGETRGLVAYNFTCHMGLLWACGALVIIITYSTGILTWSTWWQYFPTFMVFAGLCLFLSKVLEEDHDGLDDKMMRISLGLAVTTLFAVMLPEGAIGFSRLGGVRPDRASVWAADHVFVFVGLAMLVVAAYLLKTSASAAPEAVADTASIVSRESIKPLVRFAIVAQGDLGRRNVKVCSLIRAGPTAHLRSRLHCEPCRRLARSSSFRRIEY
jgi:hypothetical protein